MATTSDAGTRPTPQTTWMVGTRKGLFFVCDDQVVHRQFLGEPVTAVLHDRRDATIYVALNHGHFGQKLHRSDDGGATFTEIEAPRYPPKPDGLVDIEPMRQLPVPWSVELIWSLAAGHPDEPGTLWCGTIPGGLFRSDDRGDSWSLVEALWNDERRSQWVGGGYDFPGIHSIAVDPRGPGRLVVSVSCGGTWRTADGGASWEVLTGMRNEYMPPGQEYDPVDQDPHRTVRAPSDPNVLWTQHHNGVFRSTDAGTTWEELEVPPSSFGFAVAVHPHDADTAWFVPAVKDEYRIPVDGALVVARTRDGGATFDVARAGLPQIDAYHLVYRHAFDVDATGDRLMMGSTTGTLFASDDAGDTWRRVTGDLPPIAVVAAI
ncbi:MAG: WD40/YVTN/BNR-like repeat-containing protein [Acidimicrobiales bacterium]